PARKAPDRIRSDIPQQARPNAAAAVTLKQSAVQEKDPKRDPTSRSAEEIITLRDNGDRLLQQEYIAAARTPLRRAAEAGNADAAADLGMTFDPTFLRQVGSGATPD